MKTTIKKLKIFVLIFLSNTLLYSQGLSKADIQATKELDAAIVKMHTEGQLQIPKVICAEPIKSLLYPSTNHFSFNYLIGGIRNYEKQVNAFEKIDKGNFASSFDKLIQKYEPGSSYLNFLKNTAEVNLGALNENEKKELREIYSTLHSFSRGIPIVFVEENMGACYVELRIIMKLTKVDSPFVYWSFASRVVENCNCKKDPDRKIKSLKYEYTSNAKGVLTSKKISFEEPKNIKFELLQEVCCPSKTETPKETALEINPTENISLPNQTIGGSIGAGFEQDFEETSFCLGAEYLYNATDVGDGALFIGGNIGVETTSFMDFNNTQFNIGPTVQLFSPITPSGETHMTNGINGNYIFGTNDNNGSKDDFSGFNIGLNTGLNVPLSDNVSISLIVPIVTHTSLTFTSQDGPGEFKADETSILINKNNPAKLGLRIGF
ncbi:hypothetical protein [Patiriisocius hiemis]|uniref:Uncharacterized protein n=1 Tax=Patiriisocius hiemis TaxID=3075604 RepID=A0ABU2YD69_9FLAO|nr:hypothetical protein [Constantimarinum sp. W242]MDT0555614.1 hypothetical protein [Constantimarinum sp. W242]